MKVSLLLINLYLYHLEELCSEELSRFDVNLINRKWNGAPFIFSEYPNGSLSYMVKLVSWLRVFDDYHDY